MIDRYGPWAVVTGASEGIGRAFAVELAKKGFRLAIVARRESVLEEVAQELRRLSAPEVAIISADLATSQGIQAVIDRTKDIDVGLFVSAAGYGSSGLFSEMDIASELDMVDVNCRATVELTHALGNRMLARGKGGIVLVSSLLAWQGVSKAATYAATKAFVQSFAEGLRFEWRTLGVDVIVSAPGPVMSSFDRRANMTIRNGEKPETVARETLSGLGRRTTVVPGLLSKFLTYSILIAPRTLRIQVMKRIMENLTNHGKGGGV